MMVDIARVQSDRTYRDIIRRRSARNFFVAGSVILIALIVLMINADVSYVVGWFVIVGLAGIVSSLLIKENLIPTAIGIVRLYHDGFRAFLPVK